MASFRELRLRIPDSNATEAEFVNCFVAGLKDVAVRYKVFKQTPVNVEDTVVWAERVIMLRSVPPFGSDVRAGGPSNRGPNYRRPW